MKSIFKPIQRLAFKAWNACKTAAHKVAELVSAPALVGGSALVAGSARAAATTIDTTDVVATIAAGVTTVSAIGVAVLSLVVVIKLFKWVQRVL